MRPAAHKGCKPFCQSPGGKIRGVAIEFHTSRKPIVNDKQHIGSGDELVEHTELGLRVALVISCAKVEGTKSLHKIVVDCGEDGCKTIASSIPGQNYDSCLVGKQILVQIGLPEIVIMGVKSQARLLCCRSDGGKSGIASGKPVMLLPESNVPSGSSVW
ncbi:hypothetical protein FJZ26_01490 [Candidatus Parvarchaeota archaeon]|nr:hypothetical protein [Candidatus Parvarchaeota archaeon]